MRISESAGKSFYCEICEQRAVEPLTMGIEAERECSSRSNSVAPVASSISL